MSQNNTRADSQCCSQQKPPHFFLFPSENPPYRADSKDSGTQMEGWCEMTPRPVSWWAVTGLERAKRPGSRPAWFCLCWQPCFSGNSLGTGAGESLQELELSRGLAVLVREQLRLLVCFQQKADRLWTVSFQGTLECYISPLQPPPFLFTAPLPFPFFLFGGKVRVSWGGRNQPTLSHLFGPAWVGRVWRACF